MGAGSPLPARRSSSYPCCPRSAPAWMVLPDAKNTRLPIRSSNCALGHLPQENRNLVSGSLNWGAQYASEVRWQWMFLKALPLLPGTLWHLRVNSLSRPLRAQSLHLNRDHRPLPLHLYICWQQKYCSITPHPRQKRSSVGKAHWLSPLSNFNHYHL